MSSSLSSCICPVENYLNSVPSTQPSSHLLPSIYNLTEPPFAMPSPRYADSIRTRRYCKAIAIRYLSSGVIRWSAFFASSPRSI